MVQIIHGSETIPFDVAATRTIHFDHHDLDSALKAREDITRQIRAVEKNPKDADTPITVALELQQLRQSDNPLEKSNAEIILVLQEILEIIRGQERRVKEIEKRQTIDEFTRTVNQGIIHRLAAMKPDSALSREIARWLWYDKFGVAPSASDFERGIGRLAEDEKKAKGSREGEEDET